MSQVQTSAVWFLWGAAFASGESSFPSAQRIPFAAILDSIYSSVNRFLVISCHQLPSAAISLASIDRFWPPSEGSGPLGYICIYSSALLAHTLLLVFDQRFRVLVYLLRSFCHEAFTM